MIDKNCPDCADNDCMDCFIDAQTCDGCMELTKNKDLVMDCQINYVIVLPAANLLYLIILILKNFFNLQKILPIQFP